jgi:hypothetical protein
MTNRRGNTQKTTIFLLPATRYFAHSSRIFVFTLLALPLQSEKVVKIKPRQKKSAGAFGSLQGNLNEFINRSVIKELKSPHLLKWRILMNFSDHCIF